MADKLINELQEIKNDKDTNLLPKNLKKGVTCLGIKGTLEEAIDIKNPSVTFDDEIANLFTDLIFTYDNSNYRSYFELNDCDKIAEKFPNIIYAGQLNGTYILNTYNCNDFSSMFKDCHNLRYTDIAIWRDSSISSLTSMFENCEKLEHARVDFNFMVPEQAEMNIDNIFNNCEKLDCDSLGFVSYATSAKNAFKNCTSLSNFPSPYFNNLVDATNMFMNCRNLMYYNGLRFSDGLLYIDGIFTNCEKLTGFGEIFGDVTTIQSMTNAFAGCNFTEHNIQNIFKVCLNNPNIKIKTLKDIGIPESIASHANEYMYYDELVEAGWTTGY